MKYRTQKYIFTMSLGSLAPFCSDKENSPENFLLIIDIWVWMIGTQAVDFAKLLSAIKVKQ